MWKIPFEEVLLLESNSLRDAETEDKKGLNADKVNKVLFDYISGRKELRLFVSHDVILARGVGVAEGKRKIPGSQNDTARLFRHWKNMLEPTCEFFMAWAGMKDDCEHHEIMRYHPRSADVLYHVSFFLRDIFDLHQGRNIYNGFGEPPRRVDVTKEQWAGICDFFDIFSAADGSNDKAIVHATCAVDEEEYDRANKPTKAEKLRRERKEEANAKKQEDAHPPSAKTNSATPANARKVPGGREREAEEVESTTKSASLGEGAHPNSCNTADDRTVSAPINSSTPGRSNQNDDDDGCADENGNCSERASSGGHARDDGNASDGESVGHKSVDKELQDAIEAEAHERVGVLELDVDLDVQSDGGESSSKTAARAELSDKLIVPNTTRGRGGMRSEE